MTKPYHIHSEASRQAVADLVANLSLEKQWNVTVARHQKRRSLSQNNLYWKWVEIVAEETGNDKEDVHDVFKKKFLTGEVREVFDGHQVMRRSTADLNKSAMTEYMDRVSAFCATDLGIILPLPEDARWAA